MKVFLVMEQYRDRYRDNEYVVNVLDSLEKAIQYISTRYPNHMDKDGEWVYEDANHISIVWIAEWEVK